jgi:hypothetical protein
MMTINMSIFSDHHLMATSKARDVYFVNGNFQQAGDYICI